MIARPALARRFRAYSAPGEAVVLLGALGDVILRGAAYERVVPLLDGARTPPELAEALRDALAPAETFYALRTLEAAGCLEDAATATASGIDAIAADALHAAVAPVAAVVVADPIDAAASAAGARAGDGGAAWLPVRVGDDGHWVGPLLGADGHPCWRCVESRLLASRPAASWVRARGLAPLALPRRAAPIPAWLPARVRALLDARACAGAIVALDASGAAVARHVVRRRPECERCGRPPRAGAGRPAVVRVGRDTRPLADPRRSDDAVAAAFVRRHAALLDPVTGITRATRRLVVPGGDAVHVYVGGPNRARAADALAEVQRDLRQLASGKGRSDATARASLLGELAERHSACWRGDEPTVWSSLAALGDRAVHPNDCMRYSDRQIDARDALATAEDPIPTRLDDEAPVEWTRVWSLTRREWRLLPTAYLYFAYPRPASFAIADSNGNAAGSTLDRAILQGTLELIERDAVGIWWHNAAERPAVPLDAVDDPWIAALRAQLGRIGRELWVLDLTTDLGVATYGAVSRRIDGGPERLAFGFGAHVDGARALVRALSELAQTVAVMLDLDAAGGAPTGALGDWWRGASVARFPFVAPHGAAAPPSSRPTLRACDALDACRQAIEARGMEWLVLDQTRADVGIPVAKVMVPGLRHFRRRLAPGRLYDVPRALGWTPHVADESAVNPAVLAF